MKKQSELIKDRLRHVMVQDRLSGLETLLTVLKTDTAALLSNYMQLAEGGIEIVLETLDNGGYQLIIKARADRLFDPGKMIAWPD